MVKNNGFYHIKSSGGFWYKIFYEFTGKETTSGERVFLLRGEGSVVGRPNIFDKGTLITESRLLERLSPDDLC